MFYNKNNNPTEYATGKPHILSQLLLQLSVGWHDCMSEDTTKQGKSTLEIDKIKCYTEVRLSPRHRKGWAASACRGWRSGGGPPGKSASWLCCCHSQISRQRQNQEAVTLEPHKVFICQNCRGKIEAVWFWKYYPKTFSIHQWLSLYYNKKVNMYLY